MDLLKKENWFVWLIMYLFAKSGAFIILAFVAGLLDKKAWYAKWQYWFVGFIFFIFPAAIMLFIFTIQMICTVASKLKVAGEEFYTSPYMWLLMIIVPIFGWVLLPVVIFYLEIMILISLYEGKGETLRK